MGMLMLGRRRRWNCLISWWWLGVVLQLLFSFTYSQNLNRRTLLHDKTQADLPSPGVQLLQQDQHVVMSNGIVSITLTVPGGAITNITYKGSDNLLQTKDIEDDRGHWDVVWNKTERGDMTDNLEGTSYKVMVQNENQTEISFTRTWTVDSLDAPLNIDKRFVMLRDSPGFYSYAVLERLKGWPAFDIQEGRIVFKLQENKFHYMAMSEERQRIMPLPEDRMTGQMLDYKEAVLLTNPTNPEFIGEVHDKYLYSCDNKDNKVHGWVSSDHPPVGFWMITPSNEFRTGGPIKQDLTSHVGPIVLSMFISTHYAGEDLALKFQTQEYWKKVFGPVYIYLNSDASANTDPSLLWNDAKQRMQKEVASWPYSFPLSQDFAKSNQRGAVSGQLLVHDWFINKQAVPSASAYVGLAPPGEAGSWQFENKGYQFWTQTDRNGNFWIKNVRPGTYSLFAWVPGILGDYKHASDITITPGSIVKASNVVFEAPRKGATLWEIGIPDRTAAEFFIPDPDPKFKIHHYRVPIEKFRQYGLWTRYKDLYPQKDLVFTIGTSDYRKDWFFAHVTRNVGNGQYVATTWQILFELKNVDKGANYTLQLALASANNAELQVCFNDPKSPPHFTTGSIGKDNALARHGIRGLHHFYSIGIAGSRLIDGRNTIFLTQARSQGPFREVIFVILRDSPGFYAYAVLERLKGWPAFDISEGRIVFKLQENKFHYMAMSDVRQRVMPTPEDRMSGQRLEYKEAVLLTNPTNPEFRGEVDDKYLYSCDNKDNKVHGWVSSDYPPVGFWTITPSDEFRTGGPIRQDLTSHVGPVTLFKFMSRHYAGEDLAVKFQTEEYWKKVIGPVYIYLNSDAAAKTNPSLLWNDAKQRMQQEVNSWPYSFLLSKDFVKSNQRGAVNGQLFVHDWFINKQVVPGASAYVGLAPPGTAGSWQFENKGYQFWTQTDRNGNFLIKNVIPGTYSLFAWVPGVLGDYKHASDITITPGSIVKASNVVFEAPRKGATLWEIGIPDRTAAEFFIPDPDPKYKIHHYRVPTEKFRQYGLWTRYKDLYPQKDLVFTIGSSDYRKDWFFAHVTRNVGNGQYVATTWQILFDLKTVDKGANYTLQLALASAHYAELQVRFNDPKSPPHFTTGLIGKDNALARHGIRGLYHFYSIGVAGSRLVVGRNIIFFKQAKDGGPFREVMYDYIRLEGPA
ncbi:hypothetical protein Pfo_007943 [Paulownia fortunei]|nr:hypothetical protein Pfo_007943 [Paulownia fortunei]